MAIGAYLNNRKNGQWTYYFENKRVEQKGNYIGGRFDGEWIWNYPDGTVWRIESYFNGKEDGHSHEYDSKGNIITEGNYTDGEKDGDWFYKVGDHQEEGTGCIACSQESESLMNGPVRGVEILFEMPGPRSPVVMHHACPVDPLPVVWATLF